MTSRQKKYEIQPYAKDATSDAHAPIYDALEIIEATERLRVAEPGLSDALTIIEAVERLQAIKPTRHVARVWKDNPPSPRETYDSIITVCEKIIEAHLEDIDRSCKRVGRAKYPELVTSEFSKLDNNLKKRLSQRGYTLPLKK